MERISKSMILKYKYESKEEREQHIKYMENLGYECTGQVKRTDDDLSNPNPNYYWYGEFIQTVS